MSPEYAVARVPASQPLCIPHLLAQQAEHAPDAVAITAPGRAALTYSRLRQHIDAVVQTLHTIGVGRHDRVVLVLPNGPEMAVACLALASGATCVPLNPAYGADELDRYLTDLQAKALIIQASVHAPARAVAHARGLCLIELSPMLEAEAGLFTLTGESRGRSTPHGFAQPDDIALVLLTSGTMSRPKMIPLTHTNLWASAYHSCAALTLTERDRCLNVLPLFHGHGLIATLLASLAAGASITYPPSFDASAFFAWLAEFRPTWYSAVPTMHQAILTQAAHHRESIAGCPLRFIRSASAPLPPRVLTELERVFKVPVIEFYGMTEVASSPIACNPFPPRERKTGSVGIAVGLEVAIMDEGGTVLPAGETGEIVVRGMSVMQGYDRNPTANRDAFTHGWFRTGDLGWLDTDGYLFLTGRLKETINRGGEKIAPSEVDRVLMEHPAVAQAVTFAVPHPRLGEDIAAAVVLHPNSPATTQDIRQFAALRLADFKVPRQILLMQDIPQGPTGKLQRIGLAAQLGLTGPDQVRFPMSAGFTAPHTPVEEVLTGLWAQVLGVEYVGILDDFFALGGDSIIATQLISLIREATQIELSFSSFFEAPTVADMARHIEMTSQARPDLQPPSLQPVSRDGPLPPSYAQQRLWFLEQLGLSRHAYHVLEVLCLKGPMQVAALEQSLQEIIRRHEVLRTLFVNVEGQPRQVIRPATPLPLPVIELWGLSEREQEVQVRTLARAEVERPFDLAQGPLVRTTLVRLDTEEHVLLLALHNIVYDGWSRGVLWRELAALYEAFAAGQPSPLPDLSIQYADFAICQQQWLQGESYETLLTYWKRWLHGVSMLQLPTDWPRPAVQTSQGARHFLVVSPTLTQALKDLSRAHGVTLFMTLLAAFQVLLHRYTGQDDIPVGSLIANRTRIETEKLIGFFTNTLVLRTDLSGDPSFRELLGRVRQVTLGAYCYQELPYEKLLEELRPPRDLSRTPLFQTLFVLQNAPRQPLEFAGLSVHTLEVDPKTAKFDLLLDLSETPAGLQGCFEYSTDLFEAATMARMAGHLQTLLEGIVADPEQRLSTLPLLTADERQRLFVEWNNTSTDDAQDQCLHQVFEAQVAQSPDAVAVICADVHLTYCELNHRANQVAHYLQTLGVGPEVLVGLCAERSIEMVVGLLGILKTGAVYVPLDPAYPQERLAFMLEDAHVSVLLTQEQYVARLPDHAAVVVCLDAEWSAIAQQSTHDPVSGVTAGNLASVLYTSGTMGRPKGVLGSHRATLNTLRWLWQAYPFAPQEVCCQQISMSFVDSIQELLGPLLWGVQIVLIPHEVLRDPPRLVQTLAAHRVTRILLVPSLLRVLLDVYGDLQHRLPSLKLWFVSGEALSTELWQRFLKLMPHSRLINIYGTSEVSADATSYDTGLMRQELANVPIGRPLANTEVYLLDKYLQPVPVGVPGELHVGGAGLTRGYLNSPELTAEKFIPHPFSDRPGARLYKTGDWARYLPDGNMAYLGRIDHQVKIRGFRLELGEIETALEQHPAIRQAVVVAREDTPGDTRLVAYLLAAQEPAPPVSGLRSFLKSKLPTYMLPATFVLLDAMPLTPNGKIDHQALPAPNQARPALEEVFVSPRTPTEEMLAGIWATVLGVEEVGVYDNFFDLGGHSLMAVQVISRLRDALQVEVPVRALFEAPTAADLALYLETTRQAVPDVPEPPIQPVSRQEAVPVGVAQEQLWVLDQVLPGAPFFNLLYALRLLGPLDVVILEHSTNEIVRRHEALRTTFALVDGQLVQVIAPTLHLPLIMGDLWALPETEREDEAQRLAQEEVHKPFDLAQGPLLRVRLLRLGEQEHLLFVAMHHIISDGWSLGVLAHELAVLYDGFAAGGPSPLAELPIQYGDFAHWQRQWQYSEARQAQLAYWQQQLHGPLPMLALPMDRPRTAALSFRTARQSFVIPEALSAALTHLSRREGSTLFMTLLAAFKVLLHSYTGQEDLRVSTLVANRNRQETEGLVGLFVNTVILRTNLGGNPTFREVLQRVRATTLAAYAHQDLPFEELARTLEQARARERTALSQVLFILQNAIQRPLHLPARTLHFLEADQYMVAPEVTATTYDIVLMLRVRPQGLTGSCIYKASLFNGATISQMLEDFQHLLTRILAQPEQPLSTCGPLREDRG